MIALRALASLSVALALAAGPGLRSLALAQPPAAPALPGSPLPSPAPATPFPGTATTPLPAVSGSPAPEPLPGPSATPQPPGSSASPAPATAAPAASATPAVVFAYRFVPRQPDHALPNVPQIFAVYLNSNTLVSQGAIDIKVATDDGTVKVTSKSGGREGIIPMVAPGDFEAYSKLPKIPFIAAGMTVQLVFTAVSADGHKTSVSVPVRLK